jgi:sec-independent protein translocase protein TatA
MLGLDSPVHWIIVAIIALIVLGPKRLPEAGRALGGGLRQFKEGLMDGGGAEPERDELA